MTDKLKIKLIGADTYFRGNVTYRKGKVYEVDAGLAETLLETYINDDEDLGSYFAVATPGDVNKAGISAPEKATAAAEPGKKAAAKKVAAKKTVKVSGGKIEGLDDDADAGDTATGGDAGDEDAVEV